MYQRWLGFFLGFLVAGSGLVYAQSCRRTFGTPQNAKACITVSTTAIDIAAANTSRCSLLIQNNSVNGMNCSDIGADGAPTPTTGIPIQAGGALAFGLEGQGRWQCIRSGGADAIACVAEGRP